MAEPILTATTVTTALATSAIKAVTSTAVQASAPAWKRLVNSTIFESRKIRRLKQWQVIRNHRHQSRRLEEFLKSRLCLGLIEAYAISYATTLIEPENSSELEQLFCEELRRELKLADEDDGQLATHLWSVLTSTVKISIEELKSGGSLDSSDLLLFAQLTGKQGKEASPLSAAISERRKITGDEQRAMRALTLAAEIQRIGAKFFSEMSMPHARENYRVEVNQLYVRRKLTQLPADWKANRVRHELDDKDAELIEEDDIAERRFVVIGSPGAGKSTYIRRLLLSTSSDLDARVAPLMIELKTWPGNAGSLVDMLTGRLRASMQIDTTSAVLGDMLSLGIGLVVFDGLDEVIDINQRRALVEAIEAFATRYPLARVVVTSRREGYESASLNPLKFPAYRVPDFDQAQMEEYVHRWFSLSMALGANVGGIDAESLPQSFIDDSVHVADLRLNPLMLSLLCLLYQYEGYIPSNRARVYEECAELLFGRWDRIREVDSLVKSDVRGHHLVEQIAMHLYKRQDGQAGETESMLKLVVKEYLYTNVVDDDFRASREAEDFLQHCLTRAWLLTKIGTSPRREHLLGFTHRTFMEYFAACYIARHFMSPEELAVELKAIIASGSSDVILQLAIDRFGERAFNGVDDTLRMILFGSKSLIRRYDPKYLPFVVRSLKFVFPRPVTVKAILMTVLREYSKAKSDWGLDFTIQIPKNVQSDFDALCRSISTAEAGTPEECAAAEGARVLAARIAAAEKDLRWLRSNAPDVLVSMVMSGELALSSYLRTIGSGALVDIASPKLPKGRVCGPLIPTMRYVARSGYFFPVLEKMFKTLVSTPRYIFPMSKAAIAEVAEQIEIAAEFDARHLFGVQIPASRQVVHGFAHICAATAFEALNQGMHEQAEMALRCGFGYEWRIAEDTRADELLKLIDRSSFIELNEAWRRHLAWRYRLKNVT